MPPPRRRRSPALLDAETTPDTEPRLTERTGHARVVDPEEDVRLLVRSIAADPVRIGWLRSIVARHLDRVARQLRAGGHIDAANALGSYARAYERGEVELW